MPISSINFPPPIYDSMMARKNLNLDGLSEEELRHISEVLSRDRKLQETSKFIKIPLNNNYDAGVKSNVTASDLVSAEIDRVKRLTPVSEYSGRSTPTRGNSGSGTATPVREGIFQSFAGMISRTIVAMDISGRTKSDSKTLNALADATVKLDSIPKVPFNYNPRENSGRKATLLELASTKTNSPERSVSSPAPSNLMSQYRRSRENVAFFSVPNSGFSTIPRNFRSRELSAIPIPSNLRVRSRSPSLQNVTSSDAKQVASFGASPRNKRRVSKGCPVLANQGTNGKNNMSSLSPCEDHMRFYPSPGKRESPDGAYAQIPFEMAESPSSPNMTRARSELDVRKGKRDPITISIQSGDSGVYSKTEYFPKRSNSRIDDRTIMSNFSEPEYASASESDCDFDNFASYDITDNNSMASDCSSLLDSPMRRLLSDCALDSCGETDKRNNSPLPVSPHPHVKRNKSEVVATYNRDSEQTQPKSTGRAKGHSRNVSTGSPSTFLLSVAGSPSASAKSLTLPSRSESPLAPAKIDGMNTVGNMEISVIYYSSDSLKSKNMNRVEIPRNGTKNSSTPNRNVLSRKEYNDVTSANLQIDNTCKSGCPESMYGELHVSIMGAKFQDHSGKIKASPSTYVKCYLLPDKFHNSKMKSAVIKKNNEPRWKHTFVLAGFSQSELRERSLEIVVGSEHFKKQEIIGGAILSIGQGGPHRPWIKSTKAESYIWKNALLMSGSRVKAFLPLRSDMKPTYL